MSDMSEAIHSRHVAIIGMACRFPGADTVDAFWQNLLQGVEAIRPFSREELLAGGATEAVANDRSVRAGGRIEQADCFDARFFGISPGEAELIDPQHRLFLEAAWAALESAGYGPGDKARHVGVFGGSSISGYLLNVLAGSGGEPLDLRRLIGNDKDHLTLRVAYQLNLTGPAVTVQAACATSLVAVHMAAQSVLAGECAMALAGGASISVPQVPISPVVKGGIIAGDGHCRAFDARADGTIAGGGVGVVVLKGLSEALADGDHIHAVIRGSSINNDGREKLGYAAPSRTGQARALAAALELAEVDPRTVGYVEAHGTATPMGDATEIAALTDAYCGAEPGSCLIGSVKSNIGHLDAAAGIAGLIKAVLCLEQGQFVPSLGYAVPNPNLNLETTPFRVATRTAPWDAGAQPRRAGISAFGIGGTNVHMILQEAPARRPASEPEAHLLLLSARTEEALRASASALADKLERDGPPLADVALTLRQGRAAMPMRLALACRTATEAAAMLRRSAAVEAPPAVAQAMPAIFLFPGQGTALLGAGMRLASQWPDFANALADIAGQLTPHCGFDVRRALQGQSVLGGHALGDTIVAQPVLFALSLALGRFWIGNGVRPTGMVGHSLGEIAAATLAGVMTPDDAARLVALRGQLMQAAPAGVMLAVNLDRSGVDALLADGPGSMLDLAAVNGPRGHVVSGASEAVAQVEQVLRDRGVATRRLASQRAFHSRMMRDAASAIEAFASGLALQAPQIPFVSSVSGDWARAEQVCDPRYWAEQVLRPVQFYPALQRLGARGQAVFIELGAADDLGKIVRASGAVAGSRIVAALGTGNRADEDLAFLQAIGTAWTAGVAPDWRPMRGKARRVPLPTYPFARTPHWYAPPAKAPASPSAGGHSLSSPGWRPLGRPDPTRRAMAQRVIVLHDPQEDIDALRQSLADRAAQFVPIDIGAGAAATGPLLTGLCRRLVEQPAPPLTFVDMVSHRSPGCEPLLTLARAVAVELRQQQGTRLIAVTREAQSVGGEPIRQALGARLFGICRSIEHELAFLRTSTIDLANEPSALPALAAELAGELSEPCVVLRGAMRFGPTQHRIERTPERAAWPFRQGGVYVVTGGLGGIGAALAGHLAAKWRARLAILTRSDESELGRSGRDRLAALRAATEVLLIKGDVAEVADVVRLRSETLRRFGRVDGILHAAGVAAGAMLLSPQEQAFATTTRAKVDGTQALASAFGELSMDFVSLFSSVTGIRGAAGQAGYAAANAYLDAVPFAGLFPHAFVQSINWDTWKDAGMAVDIALPGALEDARQASLAQGLSTERGIELFEQALASGLPRVVVSGREPPAQVGPVAAAPAPPPVPAARAKPAAPMPRNGNAAARLAADTICTIWADALHLETVMPDDNVFELGADSLIALQVVPAVERHFGCELSPIVCYEAPTPRMLATLVLAGRTADLGARP